MLSLRSNFYKKGGSQMTNKTENILMRVTKEQKDFIKNKTEELGYEIPLLLS